jgi:LysR family transcriptional regulator (chromosome initiation inhibitor)
MILHPNLHAFLAVVETGTVSAAAKQLRITQTAATQRIKILERDLGVSIFIRSRSGMKLTEEGRTLFRTCIQARDLEERLDSELHMGGIEYDADIAITAPGGLIARRLVEQCAKIFERWPRLNLRFIAESKGARLNLLKTGVADLAVVMTHEITNELDSKMIAPNELVMVASAKWRGRKLDEILASERLIAYRPDDELGMEYLRQFKILDQLKRARLYANENEVILQMVILGIGFALLPRQVVLPFVKQKVLIELNDGKTLKIPLALAWYPRKEMPEYFRDLIRSIK